MLLERCLDVIARRGNRGVNQPNEFVQRAHVTALPLLLSTSLVACGAMTPPAQVGEADSMLGRSSSADVATMRPKLVADARELLARAKDAAARGDNERAVLLARQAMQKFAMAQNLSEREQAERMLDALEGSQGKSSSDARVRDLEDRLRQLEGRPGSDSPDAQRARRALDRARDRQADALRAGATSGPAAVFFQQGQSMLTSAVDAYETRAWSESTTSAQAAATAFASAAATGASSPSASSGDAPAKSAASLARADAQAAIFRAEDARGEAVRAGSTSLTEGDDALRAAQRAFDASEFDRAKEKAGDARSLFQNSARTPRPAAGISTTSSTELRTAAERAIVSLQLKRSEALGQMKDNTCPSVFREFESILELAQKRFDAGDYERAFEFAVRSEERFRACDRVSATNAASASKKEKDAEADEAARKKAATAIQRAQIEIARAQGVAPNDARVSQSQVMLASAESWYKQKSYPEAIELATKSYDTSSKINAPTSTPATTTGGASGAGGTPTKPAAVPTPSLPSDEDNKDKARRALSDARDLTSNAPDTSPADQAKKKQAQQLISDGDRAYEQGKYTSALSSANKAIDLLNAQVRDAACADAKVVIADTKVLDQKASKAGLSADQSTLRARASAQLSTADRLVAEKSCTESLRLAREANAVLLPLSNGTSPEPGVRPGTTATASAPSPRDASSAARAIADAQSLRDRAYRAATTASAKRALERGNAALDRANASNARNEYADAESEARTASAVYETILEGAGIDPAAPSNPGTSAAGSTAPGPRDPGNPSSPHSAGNAPPATREEAYIAARTQPGAAPKSADPTWRPAYSRVFQALSLRDKVAANSPHEKTKLAEADRLITLARGAWEAKNYVAAQTQADAVIALLEPVSVAPPPDNGSPEELSSLQKRADEAIREAGIASQVCEKESCGDRDIGKTAEGKELLDSARRSYGEKRYSYAAELAGRARTSFDAVLRTPRKTAPDPGINADELKRLQGEADDALREANITRKLCEPKGCKDKDPEAWIRAQENLASAQAAYADKRYDVARDQARKVDEALKKVLNLAPPFTIAPSISSVTRFANQLKTNPPIQFNGYGNSVSNSSKDVIANLARVIMDNKAIIKKVNLVGYTDSQGPADANKKRSAERAASLLKALVAAGVPAEMLSADGRGPDNPIGDNATQAGRELNRRVEIVLDLIEGAK